MITTITLIAGSLVGIFLFAFLLPRLRIRLFQKVQKTEQLDEIIKDNLLALLQPAGDTKKGPGRTSDWMLPLIFFLLLGMEITSLYLNFRPGAILPLIGMFVMLAVHVLTDDQEAAEKLNR